MIVQERDIVGDCGGKAWIHHNRKAQHLTVYLVGPTHSTSDCHFAATLDGLSLALARRDWHNRQPGLPRLPPATKAQLMEIAARHGFAGDC